MKAAVSAGSLLLEYSGDRVKTSPKESLRDIVTEVDMYAEKKVISILRKADPGCQILTEETGRLTGTRGDKLWIVDALDGTVNYVNHIPLYNVSISCVEKGNPVVGVIYNPVLGDLYYGAEGYGVYRNHVRIKVKDGVPGECLFAAAFSGKKYDPASRSEEFLAFEKVNDTSRGCLRTGSASLNLSYVAEGRLGGCWGKANKIWDIAAGIIIANLAGAHVEYHYLNPEKSLVSYAVAVPSAWDYLSGIVLPRK
ncbi:MAG: hypothetical protein LUQ66_06560 [Methanoregula sp.]|nr:hypothetical protein [Methanoregula sp.]